MGDLTKCYLKCPQGYAIKINNSYSLSTDIKKAEVFESPDKARNVKESNFAPLLRDRDWKVVMVTPVKKAPTIPAVESVPKELKYTKIPMENLKEQIKTTGQMLKTIKENEAWLSHALSEIDKEIVDIEHYIELYPFSACEGYKLAKKIKDLRVKRREIKNELEVIKLISDSNCMTIAKGTFINHLNNLETKQYTPRVLQDLFTDRTSKTA